MAILSRPNRSKKRFARNLIWIRESLCSVSCSSRQKYCVKELQLFIISVFGSSFNRPINSIVSHIAVGAEFGFDSRVGQIGHRVAAAAMSLRSCVLLALSRNDGPRGSLHASA